jgi:pyruvate dehydrogenase E2 component (dihydrolipoamide acetyltransferase)
VTEFKLPELGENIDQGDLVRLMVSLGASVTEGQPVMELSDKAVVEVPSSVTGTVKETASEGQKVKVGQVIFTVENGAGARPRVSRPGRRAQSSGRKAPADKPAPVAKAAAMR